jgi:hypothetical protein
VFRVVVYLDLDDLMDGGDLELNGAGADGGEERGIRERFVHVRVCIE